MKPFDPETAKNGDKVCLFKGNGFFIYVGPTKRTVWINVYKTGKALWWNSKEDALLFTEKDNLIGTYPLEIEE